MLPLGELLRARREGFGASIDEVAKWSGIEPSRLAEIETMEDMPSTDFEWLCRGLGIAPGAVLAGEQNSPTRSVARFRSALDDPNALAPADLRLIATASEIGRTLGGLMDMQGRELRFDSLRVLQVVSPTMLPWEHGYRLGEAARERLVPSQGPISELESTLTRLGVHVARVKFTTSGIEAAGVWESGSVPVILLNSATWRVAAYSLSRRAIMAHELCHLLHDGGEADIATRATCAKGTHDYQERFEQRARGFAPAFLAPRSQVREWAAGTKLPTDAKALVTRIAEYWGLSFEGAIWHAKNCGLIPPDVADQLYEQKLEPRLPADSFEIDPISISPAEVHPDLPEEAAPLMDGLAARLVVDAFKSSIITLGRAKELLAWS